MLLRLRGLDDEELVSVMLTGREIRFITAALKFAVASERVANEDSHSTLKQMIKKFKGYL